VCSEYLYIDGQVACRHIGFGSKANLRAVIAQGDGAGEVVECEVAGFWSAVCSASIGGVPLDLTPGSRLDARDIFTAMLAVGGSAVISELSRDSLSRPMRLLVKVTSLVFLWAILVFVRAHLGGWRKWRFRPGEMTTLSLSQKPPSAGPK
jgi:hypothetical protein